MKKNNVVIIEGATYTKNELLEKANKLCADPDQPGWIKDVYSFIINWFDESKTIAVKTSGTTGTPKMIRLSKAAMISSAKRTLSYFNVKAYNKVMLCLPARFIAGKMMIVRAMVGKLNLLIREPSANFYEKLDEVVDFVALVPIQMQRFLEHPEKQKYVKTVLIGAAPLDEAIEKEIQQMSSPVYHSYGMTETITHVALRQINGLNRSKEYIAIAGVTFSTDEKECLLINADFLPHTIHTKDVVDLLDSHRFEWRGRVDTVINSGGIKIFPEEIEKKLNGLFEQRFIIAGIPDEELGEKVSLILEGPPLSKAEQERLTTQLKKVLDKYSIPKAIHTIPQFPETPNGKIKRKQLIVCILPNYYKEGGYE